MKVIETKKLVKRYNDVTAVNKIDLTIMKGEIYGLLGPNGAGKTTFINLICDMVKKDSGDIVYFDGMTSSQMNKIKQNIGVVPQNIAIYEDLTAKENIRFFASLYGLKGKLLEERVEEALSFVGLSNHAKKYPKTFSGGMKRRLNIACAIAHHPQLIIMDEPTVGIDPQSRNHILNSVKKLNELGSTTIYTTHLMEEAEFLCTRIGIIDHGKVIAEGTVSELQSIATDQKTIVLQVEDVPENHFEALKEIKGVIDVLSHEEELVIECAKESDILPDIINHFSSHQVKIKDINMQSVSLESAFLSLTGRRLRD